jgi:hypothetical protein
VGPITLQVRRYRGPVVTEHLRIRVPRSIPRGTQRLKLVGTALDDATGEGDISTIVIDALGSGSNAGDPGPPDLRSVIDSVQGNARYDGVHATFPDLGRHGRSLGPVFLDPKLRISGTANVTLHVR